MVNFGLFSFKLFALVDEFPPEVFILLSELFCLHIILRHEHIVESILHELSQGKSRYGSETPMTVSVSTQYVAVVFTRWGCTYTPLQVL